jgi:AraC family transcriptional regulator
VNGMSGAASPRGGLPGGALRRIDDFIRDHIGEELRLAGLAELAHLSSGHFIRAFKQSVGCTPWQYVLDQRLEAAEHLLRQGMPPTDAARQVGLVNSTRLNRLYRQRRGMALGAWQRMRDGK